MPLVVGNLLTDPAAQSFISLIDADLYLEVEQNDAWNTAAPEQKEAALVRASRWLAQAFVWRCLTPTDIARVGFVAARLASESLTTPLFTGIDTSAIVTSEKVGPIAVTYGTGMRADAAGMRWPWLRSMLWGLVTFTDGGAATVRVVRS